MKTIFAFFMLVGISLWETEAVPHTNIKHIVKVFKNFPEILDDLVKTLCVLGRSETKEENKIEAIQEFREKLSCTNADPDCEFSKILETDGNKVSEITSDNVGDVSKNLVHFGTGIGLTDSVVKFMCDPASCSLDSESLKNLKTVRRASCEDHDDDDDDPGEHSGTAPAQGHRPHAQAAGTPTSTDLDESLKSVAAMGCFETNLDKTIQPVKEHLLKAILYSEELVYLLRDLNCLMLGLWLVLTSLACASKIASVATIPRLAGEDVIGVTRIRSRMLYLPSSKEEHFGSFTSFTWMQSM